MAVPLQTWVGKQFGKLRVRTAGKTDRRIRLMNEIVNGMKVIKMYTWEKPFANLVHESREEEIGVVRNTSYYRAFNFSFFFSASRFILLCTFLVFGFTGEVLNLLVCSLLSFTQVLTAEKAFLCLSMFNTVRLSMTLFFPFAISQWGEMRVSINRIQDFLVLEEREEGASDGEDEKEGLLKGEEQRNKEAKGSVSLQKVTGRWRKEEEDTLSEITMEVRSSQYYFNTMLHRCNLANWWRSSDQWDPESLRCFRWGMEGNQST